jgi:hypothetical protein
MTAAVLAKPGTLVHARGREWVVLPDSDETLLMVRPVGGLDEEVTGLLPAIEPVSSATFPLPTPGGSRRFRFRAFCCATRRGYRRGPPPVPSAASDASPSSRVPISSCR